METNILGILAITLYLFAWVLSIRCAKISNKSSRQLIVITSSIGLLLHFMVLWELVVQHWVNLGFYHAISFASAFLVGTILITQRWYRLSNLLLFALPIAIISLSLELAHPEPIIIAHASTALDIHILLSLLAYSFLTIGAILAVIAYLQERLLKSKRLTGLLQAFPPLFEVEHALFKVILLGFILLTASLISGFMFLDNIFAQQLLHKTFFSILSWLVFAVLLAGHARYGWRGSLATKLALIGFIFVILAYFGSKAVIELLL